jgi:hypothetical protein
MTAPSLAMINTAIPGCPKRASAIRFGNCAVASRDVMASSTRPMNSILPYSSFVSFSRKWFSAACPNSMPAISRTLAAAAANSRLTRAVSETGAFMVRAL